MNLIWKFTLDPFEGGQVQMPAGAKVLHVHEQNGSIRIWAEVDSDAETVTRRFLAVPTGNTTPDGSEYLGSAHVEGGDGRMYVFHVYDAGEPVAALTSDTLRAELANIEGCLESTSPDEVVGYWEKDNPAAALELLERDYHVQMACGNAGRAEAIHAVITRIGEAWASR